MREGRKIRFARQLRRRMTDAEQALWFHLRNRALMACKFRRQHPIGRFVVDFACLAEKLVVELDGSQHLDSVSDPVRDAEIEAQGYRILRFWNNDVLLQPLTVLSVIFDALADSRALATAAASGATAMTARSGRAAIPDMTLPAVSRRAVSGNAALQAAVPGGTSAADAATGAGAARAAHGRILRQTACRAGEAS